MVAPRGRAGLLLFVFLLLLPTDSRPRAGSGRPPIAP